jgi:hypothetical protein
MQPGNSDPFWEDSMLCRKSDAHWFSVTVLGTAVRRTVPDVQGASALPAKPKRKAKRKPLPLPRLA